MTTPLIQKIAADSTLDPAYDWLCRQRADYSENSDIWDLRWHWDQIRPIIQHSLVNGDYVFSPLQEYRFDCDTREVWSAKDALVLKAMSLVLGEHLAPHLSDRCFHLAGNGGVKAAVRSVFAQLDDSPEVFVMKSDVKGYYANIDHYILFEQLESYIDDRFVLRLLWQYLKRTVTFGGLYREVNRGISLGCPLSPLMGALYLKPLDDVMANSGLFYARFMDDWIVFAPTRWKLRSAVRTVNQTLSALKLRQHPDKTFIGRAKKGFDFLGYQFDVVDTVSATTIDSSCDGSKCDGQVGTTDSMKTPPIPPPSCLTPPIESIEDIEAHGPIFRVCLSVAKKSYLRFVERATQLYEQEKSPEGGELFWGYVRRWMRWVRAGLCPCFLSWAFVSGT